MSGWEPSVSEFVNRNRLAWQRMASAGHRLAKPVSAEELAAPLASVDSMGWLGPSIAGWRVLCLAAGGGRHGPLYAAAGGNVTVVDFSSEMLERDRVIARQYDLHLRLIETSMDQLSALQDSEFDLVIHPVSTCYLPEIRRVYREVARVTRPGGLYVSQHKQPASLQSS
ncbi:MAG TPA: class I SAM-dependent methyltransferase, partial [Pirellulaceae bacterium]|nr:class I SAM-dependent methyltransferase [Pirellulaceae bacterium]